MFLKSLLKRKERWPGEHRMQDQFRIAGVWWNRSDVRLRVKVLQRIDREADAQVFQAYVQAQFTALPYELQLKVMGASEVYQSDPTSFD